MVAIGLSIAGCAGAPASAPGIAEMETIPENPVELVNQLSSEISAARTEQINILSPNWFSKAESAFFDAQKDLKKGREIADIEKSAIESRSYLAKAREIAGISRSTLAEVLEARKLARDAGATRFEKPYRSVEDAFLNLTGAIEKDNLSYAQKHRDKVVERYRELEVKAIKESTIGEVRRLIESAESSGAKKIAPQSYDAAVSQLEETDAFISANPHAKQAMHDMANESLFKANRLVVITNQSDRIKAMAPEDIVLWAEGMLERITTQLGAQDMRNQDYATQVDNIIGSIDALKSDRDFVSQRNQALQTEMQGQADAFQARLDALNVKVATLEGKTRDSQMATERLARERKAAEQRLAAERKFNQQYVNVQNYFDKDEAEVYKQENQLVIRLKAMRFPVGKSIIMPENYALLSKVQKAIRTFNDPRVIVEGHTDSTGSDDVNMLLSQQRAEAVREYMIANQTLPPDGISAVGYGSERPLASNATTAGRAINRRIDIIIVPQVKPI
jgi:outer membrane protein OmpA-like peptidoglycan-associated protein